MATVHVCDCGKQKIKEKNELIAVGVCGRLYCKGDCQARAQAYLDARDDLHNEIIDTWNDGMSTLKNVHGDNFELPDTLILSQPGAYVLKHTVSRLCL